MRAMLAAALLTALPVCARAQRAELARPCATGDIATIDWAEVSGQLYALRLPPGFREVEARTPRTELGTFDRREWRAPGWRLLYEEGHDTTPQPADSGAVLGNCMRQVGDFPVELSIARLVAAHGTQPRYVVVASWDTPGDHAYRFTGFASTPADARRLAAAFGTLMLRRPRERRGGR